MSQVYVADELDCFATYFNEVLDQLGDEFTFEDFRKKMTQRNQVAYIDLLLKCRDYEHPFGQAHRFIADRFRPLIKKRGYRRINEGRKGGERNTFGDTADRIVYRRR